MTGKYPVKGVCRSCKPHMVRGAWYTPQLFYDYDETAIASWYGPRFHGKQKANGEIFDQTGMSAAHKTLPLPTVVKVTNLENGKMIYLVVDDRGPYTYEGRIIDLSMGAAKAIGVYAKGTAKVRVQSVPAQSHALAMHLAKIGNKWGAVPGRIWEDVYREDIAPNHSDEVYEAGSGSHHPVPGYKHGHKPSEDVVPIHVPSASLDDLIEKHAKSALPQVAKNLKKTQKNSFDASYKIQLASFVNRINAEKLVGEIQGLAQAKVEEKIILPGKQKFFTVTCGPYANKDAAEMALTSLNIFGHHPTLIKQ